MILFSKKKQIKSGKYYSSLYENLAGGVASSWESVPCHIGASERMQNATQQRALGKKWICLQFIRWFFFTKLMTKPRCRHHVVEDARCAEWCCPTPAVVNPGNWFRFSIETRKKKWRQLNRDSASCAIAAVTAEALGFAYVKTKGRMSPQERRHFDLKTSTVQPENDRNAKKKKNKLGAWDISYQKISRKFAHLLA